MSEKIGALVLAAGFSKRFGSLKLDAKLSSGETVFQATLRNIRQGLSPPLVITRSDVLPFIADNETDIRVFDDAELGMGATLAFGIEQAISDAGREWDGCLICLADMPFIKPTTYQEIATNLTSQNIVVPQCNGKSGNPIGFGKEFFGALKQLNGDQGGRSIIKSHQNAVIFLDTADSAIFNDIDTPHDIALFDENSQE